MSKRIGSHTRVQVTVEISGSSYGEDWKLSELIKQSGEEAVMALGQILQEKQVRVIGQPKVLCITHFED